MKLLQCLLLCLCISGCGDVAEQIEISHKKGVEYGKTHSLYSCFDESMNILDECNDIKCAQNNLGFPKGCSEVSAYDEKFCEQVPDGVLAASQMIKSTCDGHKFEKACYKYIQYSVAQCMKNNET